MKKNDYDNYILTQKDKYVKKVGESANPSDCWLAGFNTCTRLWLANICTPVVSQLVMGGIYYLRRESKSLTIEEAMSKKPKVPVSFIGKLHSGHGAKLTFVDIYDIPLSTAVDGFKDIDLYAGWIIDVPIPANRAAYFAYYPPSAASPSDEDDD